MDGSDVISSCLQAANWVWGIATEEGFVKAVAEIYKRAQPWYVPAMRWTVGQLRWFVAEWRDQIRAQPRDWKIITLAVLFLTPMIPLAIVAHGLSGSRDAGLLLWFLGIVTVILGVVNVVAYVKLANERLIPWIKAQR